MFSSTALAASEKSSESSGHAVHFGLVFAMFALVLIAGKIGNAVERWGIPAVLGELLAGIFLSFLGYHDLSLVGDIQHSEVMAFIASFGALLLLFSIGLEANVSELKKVGVTSLLVALIGVVVPFITGAYILGPIFFADEPNTARLFLGASLVATSVGITASVFRSLKMTRTRVAQTVLGAAVIDDVLGLIVLAIVSAIASGGDVTSGFVAALVVKSFTFLAGSVILGKLLAGTVSRFFTMLHSGVGMKVAVAVSLALIFGYMAEQFGLEPIIGAFAAGLFLDDVHFKDFAEPEVVDDLKALEFEEKTDREKVLRVINKHKESHVEDLINNIGLIFIPIFFVFTGIQVDIGSLTDPSLYLIAGLISIAAIVAKLVSGFVAKGSTDEKLLVGFSMVPRGEVGLIFAATGRALGVLSDEIFSVILLVVIITTFIAPPIIKYYTSKLYPEKTATA